MTPAKTAARVPPLSTRVTESLQHKIDRKTKPPGSLGRLEELALQLGRIQDSLTPEIRSPAMLIFAGDHGATEAGISPYPKEVTAQMVRNFLHGGAAINVFARQNGLRLFVIDAGVDADFPDALLLPVSEAERLFDRNPEESSLMILDAKVRRGTRNFVKEDALTPQELAQCFEHGAGIARGLVARGATAVGFGEMGIGNTSAASLLQAVLTGRPLKDCVGRGTGHNDEGLKRKGEILARALRRFESAQGFGAPLAREANHDFRAPSGDESAKLARSALLAFGGLEMAMMAGAMIEAAANRMLVMVDGYITTAAALAAVAIEPALREYCVFSHVSGEQGHRAMLAWLDARPLLDLDMRLGEGTGAALAFSVVTGAANFLNEMASFEDAGVSDRADEPD
ncbi:MAG: nicotinate-nucleotide--dimethylbenzimidazole phosphoribosyltransferase [Leptospirales bacterium]|jgi:nicotinate-nucleotide--dimethylbenzimidazole phosphoribosyltransferase